MIQVGLQHFLVVGTLLFCLGILCVLTRRNAVAVLIGIELMLNAAGLNFIAFARYRGDLAGASLLVLFVIVLAAAEAAAALALILAFRRQVRTLDVDHIDSLKG